MNLWEWIMSKFEPKQIKEEKQIAEEDIINEAKAIWKNHAILREGYRNKVYKDSLGKPTAGIGHLITPQDKLKVGDIVTDSKIMAWFEKDSETALKLAIRQSKQIGKFNPEFLAALISVNYQLGDFSKVFKNTYSKLVSGNWQGGITGIQQSLWAKQTPVRVADFKEAIKQTFS